MAMPELKDPNFFQTVTLICQHNENGALGVVINRPIESLALHDVLSQLELGVKLNQPAILEPVYAGGPVHNELGLVLHEGLGSEELQHERASCGRGLGLAQEVWPRR